MSTAAARGSGVLGIAGTSGAAPGPAAAASAARAASADGTCAARVTAVCRPRPCRARPCRARPSRARRVVLDVRSRGGDTVPTGQQGADADDAREHDDDQRDDQQQDRVVSVVDRGGGRLGGRHLVGGAGRGVRRRGRGRRCGGRSSGRGRRLRDARGRRGVERCRAARREPVLAGDRVPVDGDAPPPHRVRPRCGDVEVLADGVALDRDLAGRVLGVLGVGDADHDAGLQAAERRFGEGQGDAVQVTRDRRVGHRVGRDQHVVGRCRPGDEQDGRERCDEDGGEEGSETHGCLSTRADPAGTGRPERTRGVRQSGPVSPC